MLHLPPYSPDPNPMEQLFSKLKPLLRTSGHATRRRSGRPSEKCSTAFQRRSAGTASGIADVSPSKSKPL
ncbi:hypothetical protein GR328_15485 [Microvirga makkahensis]|uniref:Tc1-like transposase DDE domain-containing protein n=1 Tax=Microvirga makkahensis TaxID=1128670 RepID=A0A7X3MTR9_9HYPH|nr:hypothetical protein [Microvirga makkahensis]